jgi:Tfp pilus assembly protein PilN
VRPVNLIPAEERPGGRKPLRAGPLAYIVVGALAAAVIAITALVVTDGKVSDRKTEVTQLETEKASYEAKATALAPYSSFSSVRAQRVETITSLADSRFDWERVMKELSLVLPADIQLTSLNGTVSAGVSTGGGGSGSGLRSGIPGPALELVGCAPGQAAVADFIEALKEIDGVTRVGMPASTIGGGEGGGASAGTCGGSSETAQFQMVVGFDAAPVVHAETGEGATAEVAPEGEATTSESNSTESSSGESEEGTTS